MTSLSNKIETMAAESGIELGVAIRHIESGEEAMHNADSLFVLASAVKVPVLVEAFHQVEAGGLRLDERLFLRQESKVLGSGLLTFMEDGLCPTVKDLLTLMIIISDNTATDILLERLGIQNVDETMHRLGLSNIHVAYTIHGLFEDMLPSADPAQDRYELARYRQKHGVDRSGFAFQLIPENNVGSPRDLTRLMEMIFKGEAASREACDAMLEILLKQQLNDRLPRSLPVGTRVAHKTGSFEGVRNDTGIIYVNESSHIAITTLARWNEAAYLKDVAQQRERGGKIDGLMGNIALAAYQEFGGATTPTVQPC